MHTVNGQSMLAVTHASSGFLGESIDKRNKKYPESLVRKFEGLPDSHYLLLPKRMPVL
jgi:hypothetical protein